LRRYILARIDRLLAASGAAKQAGAYTRPLFCST